MSTQSQSEYQSQWQTQSSSTSVGSHTMAAPEIDGSSAVAAVTMLLMALAILNSKRKAVIKG